MRVYHRTTDRARDAILSTGRFVSHEGDEVCVSNRRSGQATGYGTAVVTLDVPARLLALDDEFPDGEKHYRVSRLDIVPEMIRDRLTA